MCDIQSRPFQLPFNASLEVGFHSSRVTSDGGLVLMRELDERLGLRQLIEQSLTDTREMDAEICFADLSRQSVCSRHADYESLIDAEKLSGDPTFRLISWERAYQIYFGRISHSAT